MLTTVKPDVIVPDTSPLIHLAAVNALSILNRLGSVVLADMVVYEATADLSKPWAPEIAAWIAEGQREGSNAPVTVETTETGETFRLALQTDPSHRAPNAGEVAIVEWLAERIEDTTTGALVVYENGKVPRVIAQQGMNANIAVVTTRALLQLAELQGIIPSAEDLWQKIEAAVPTVNPAIRVNIQRPTGKP